MGSTTVRLMKQALVEAGRRVLRVAPNSTTFRTRLTDMLVYYGGNTTRFNSQHVLNGNRSIASNKLSTLYACGLAGLETVPWTTDKDGIPRDWEQIVARATLTGHSGEGITIHKKGDTLPDVPLYTKYVKKTYECRIHIFKGRMIDAQIKRKVRDVEENNPFIRNLHTGWVYCREGFNPDQRAIDFSIAACNATNLDFGAVDLIYNSHYNLFYILEVNTAPGLSGTPLSNYTNALIEESTHAN